MFYKIPSSCILLFELAHQKLKLVRCQGFEFWNYFQMCYIFLRLVWFMHKLVEFYTTSISSRYYPVAFGAWSYHRQCKFIVIENDKSEMIKNTITTRKWYIKSTWIVTWAIYMTNVRMESVCRLLFCLIFPSYYGWPLLSPCGEPSTLG